MLFAFSVFAIVPLAALLSHATESVAARTGDAVGGLLNATLGNLTELVITLTALRAGQYMLVKASIAGAIVTNTLFMLGASFLLGGMKYHTQEYNRVSARFQAGLLFLATIALLIPSALSQADAVPPAAFTDKLSVGLSVLLIAAYGLGMLFSLKTHREEFASAEHEEAGETPWPLGLALAVLAGVTVLVALVSEFSSSRCRRRRGSRNVAGVRRVHRRGAGRRSGRDGLGVFGRAQEPAGLERGHCARQRVANRALRRAGAGAGELSSSGRRRWICSSGRVPWS
jgi:calcium/proton exchanger cax